MKVTKTSPFSGEKRTLEVNITEEVMDKFRKGKINASQAFYQLPESERRFLVDGITPEEWEEMFEEEDLYLYDRQATRAFWICYSATLVVAIAFCYLVFWE